MPAVSLAIRELEEYYGVVLFDRVGRRLRLTAAGTRFGEYAGCILAMFDDMEKGMRNWDAFGLLRVGSSITIGSQFLPYYVNAFYARHPGTEVKVLVGPSDQLNKNCWPESWIWPSSRAPSTPPGWWPSPTWRTAWR